MSRDNIFIATYLLMMFLHLYRRDWLVGGFAAIVILIRLGVPK